MKGLALIAIDMVVVPCWEIVCIFALSSRLHHDDLQSLFFWGGEFFNEIWKGYRFTLPCAADVIIVLGCL